MTTELMTTQNRKSSREKHITKLFLLFSGILLSEFVLFDPHFVTIIKADTASNPNYSIDSENVDTNPEPTQKPQVFGSQSKQPSSDFTTGPNYTVTPTSDSLSFSLSQNITDYGILTATNPIIRTSTLSVSTSQQGTQVLGYEDHSLRDKAMDIIPETGCDNGACTRTIAAPWTSTLTYGVGYRCDSSISNLCEVQFTTPNTFKQFADASAQEQPEMIFSSTTPNSKLTAKITNKINIAGTQKKGIYINSITYLAVPNF